MGATISVCNLTVIILNVALKHLGPLYYHNQLIPGECATFKTGQVWFTVEARVWKNGTNDYNDAMVALPIVGLQQGIGAIVSAGANMRSIKEANEEKKRTSDPRRLAEIEDDLKRAKIVTAVGFIPATAIGVAGIVVNEIDRVHPRLIARKTGVLMKPGKRINIRGGPQPWQVQFSNWTQNIVDSGFPSIRIETP